MLTDNDYQKLNELTMLAEKPAFPEDKRAEFLRRIHEIKADAAEYDGPNGFEQFLADRIREEHENNDSEAVLCSCGLYNCALKRGEMPPQLRQHGSGVLQSRSTEALVRDYIKNHPAEVVARAHRDWQRRAEDLRLELYELYEEVKRLEKKIAVENDLDDEQSDDSGSEVVA